MKEYVFCMDALETILSRRAVRNWTDEKVPDELLQRVLEAGRYSPSPLNSQPWHFTVVRNPETISALMKHARHGQFLSRANIVIVVTVSTDAAVDAWLSDHEQHILSAACALQNMWLAATSLGLGGCWVTQDSTETHSILSIPDTQKLLGSLALGYPSAAPKVHSEDDRRPLESMVSYERFSGEG